MGSGSPVYLVQVSFCWKEVRNRQLLLGMAYLPQASHNQILNQAMSTHCLEETVLGTEISREGERVPTELRKGQEPSPVVSSQENGRRGRGHTH